MHQLVRADSPEMVESEIMILLAMYREPGDALISKLLAVELSER